MEEGLASAPVTFVSEQRVFVIQAVSAHILISQAGLLFEVQAVKDTHTHIHIDTHPSLKEGVGSYNPYLEPS